MWDSGSLLRQLSQFSLPHLVREKGTRLIAGEIKLQHYDWQLSLASFTFVWRYLGCFRLYKNIIIMTLWLACWTAWLVFIGLAYFLFPVEAKLADSKQNVFFTLMLWLHDQPLLYSCIAFSGVRFLPCIFFLFQMILRMLDNCTIQPDEVRFVCCLVCFFTVWITQHQVFWTFIDSFINK